MNTDFPLFRTLRLKWWVSVIALLLSIGALIYSDRTLRVAQAALNELKQRQEHDPCQGRRL